jgi:hypothetical protein
MTWTTPFELALLAWLPGVVLFRAPLLDPRRRASLGADERLFWAIVMSIGISLVVTLALASLGWYRYGRVLALNGIFTALGVMLWRGRLRLRTTSRWLQPRLLVPIALVGLCLWLFRPPAEYVMGGKDPGTYMNEGIQIAQRGGLVTRDPVIATVPPAFRDLFFPSHQNPSYYGLRFMGFFVMDPEKGDVLGQFPHLFPASLALGYGVNGLTGARWTTIAWATLGVLAVYFTGARLTGWLPAAVGSGLLALNVIEVWFARYPNAEVVAQALLFAALGAWSRAQADDDPFFGPVAASLVGMLLFLRVDMVIALAAFTVAAALLYLAGRRLPIAFFALVTLWLAFAVLYLFGLMQPYMARPVGFVANLPGWQLVLLLTASLLALALVVASARLRLVRSLLQALPWVLIVITGILATYAYFLREPGGRIAEHDAMALRSFAWYVTPAGLVAAMLGYAIAVRRFLLVDPVLLVTLTLYASFFFYKLRIVPDHFWMTRRFLPVILPGALLMVGFAAFGRWRNHAAEAAGARGDRSGWRPLTLLRFGAGAVLVAYLAVQFWQPSRPLLRHVEHAGLIPKLEALASTFDDRDLVIVESRNASDLHVLALPLAYIYARNLLVLNSPRPDPLVFKSFLDWARTAYSRVFFMGGGGTDLLSRSVGIVPIASDRFQIPEWESAHNAQPAGLRHKEFDFSIYRFDTDSPGPGPPALDVGVNDDLNVRRFHAKERDAHGVTYRWTRDVSHIALLGIRSTDRRLVLVLNDGHRPASVPKAQVEVTVDGRTLGRLIVNPDFHTYELEIPPDIAASAAGSDRPLQLTLTTNAWQPRAALGTPDDRMLGVMVDRVETR